MATASALNSAEYRGLLDPGDTSFDDTNSSYRRCPPNGGRLKQHRPKILDLPETGWINPPVQTEDQRQQTLKPAA
jgi:hypothetical protein